MKLKARRKSIQATVDMTPMIDVVFQLIISFLFPQRLRFFRE
ncbi:MAG: biopolymer transporter ExbD [Treponema sp.]|nr:MAG: biopolymer transporter ExbD [Treponema sp.]